MTPGLRIPTTPAFARRLALLAVLAGLLFGLEATPAGAVVTEAEGAKVGLQPTEISRYWEGTRKWDGLGLPDEEHPNVVNPEFNPSAPSFGNVAGAPVMHSVKTYAIYWDPEDYYHGDWQAMIDGFLGNLAGASGQLASVFAIDGQYTDVTNSPAATRSSFLGAYTDTNAYPRNTCVNPHPFELGSPLSEASPSCLTDAQIKEQLAGFIAGHGLQKGMSTIFYLLTPPGVSVCLGEAGARCSEFQGSWEEIEADQKAKQKAEEEEKAYVEPETYKRFKKSFCSYHSAIGAGDENTILYAVIPWTAGNAGDGHLLRRSPINPKKLEEVPGYACQDGGFAPNTKAVGELEEKERVKPPTPKEEEEFAKESSEEKRKHKEAEELGLLNAHIEEPNQISGRTIDGTFDTGLADLIINQIAVEQQNTITDPLLDAWQDGAGNEVTDECRNFFVPASGGSAANPETRAGTLANQALGGKNYYLNAAFSLAALRLPYPGVQCRGGIDLAPQFTSPVFANSGEVVGFDGMESDITLNIGTEYGEKGEAHNTYARYTWSFGDGSEKTGYAPGAPPGDPSTLCELPWLPPCDASVFHSYQYGGTYNVTLTVKDVGGDIASISHPITVSGPPPPASTPVPSPAGGAGSKGSGSAGGSETKMLVLPAPVARAAAVSTSLEQATRSGLVVSYSVNEQVAGRFEVLLDAATAHRLKITGRPATKLPAGTPRSLVIGQALLVTTKAGRSSVRIKFNKSTAHHLRRAHKVTLMLRLTAHNASTQNPLFTTVLNTVVLHG